MGVKIAVPGPELDAFNECLTIFQAAAEEAAPGVKFLGMLVEIKTEAGEPGCLVLLGPDMTYEKFAEILKEMGRWMTLKSVQ